MRDTLMPHPQLIDFTFFKPVQCSKWNLIKNAHPYQKIATENFIQLLEKLCENKANYTKNKYIY